MDKGRREGRHMYMYIIIYTMYVVIGRLKVHVGRGEEKKGEWREGCVINKKHVHVHDCIHVHCTSK